MNLRSASSTSGARRKRPRKSEEESKEERGEATAAGQPPSARLYRHALESIFAFLSLADLHAVLSVSRLWSSAVGSMASVGAAVESLPAGRSLLGLATSRLARHIGTLGSERNPIALSQEGLYLAGIRLIGLRSLFYKMPSSLTDGPLVFPPSLTRLVVPNPIAASPLANLVIAEAGRCPSLTYLSLTLGLGGSNPLVSFAPLRSSALQELHLPRWFPTLSSAQANDLRAIPQLTSLDRWFDLPKMRLLLRAPHELKWQKLKVSESLDDELTGLLASLPSLTDLSANGCDDVSFLSALPNLRALMLNDFPADSEDLLPPEQMIKGLGQCTQLTSLAISSSPLTSAHMAALLSCMPALSELNLRNMWKLESLSFLSSELLQRSLTSLEMAFCQHKKLRTVDLRLLYPLQQLTSLHITYCFSDPLNSFTKSKFQPPSLRLPKLVTCVLEGTGVPEEGEEEEEEEEKEAEE